MMGKKKRDKRIRRIVEEIGTIREEIYFHSNLLHDIREYNKAKLNALTHIAAALGDEKAKQILVEMERPDDDAV